MSQHAENATVEGVPAPRKTQSATAPPGTGTAAARRRTSLLVTFLLGALAAVPPLSMDMYLPALPEVAHTLGSDSATVQLTLTACLVGMAVGQVVVGPMSDKWGRRRPLLTGLVTYVLAAAICACAPSAELLIGFRLVQGLAGAAGIVIARAMVRDLYDGLAMARFFSTLLLISSLAPIIAPVIGAQVLHVTDWRGIFVVLTVVGIALTLLVWRRLPESLPPEKRQSGGVRSALWVMRGLFADRVFTGYMLTNGFAYGALFSYIAASPFVIQEVYGASPQTFSLLFGLNSLGLMAVGQINGRLLVGRVKLDKALGWGLAILLAGAGYLLLVTTGVLGRMGTLPLAIGLFVMISSLGLILPNTNALALMRTPHAAGSAAALVGTSCFIMGAIASSLVGVVADSAVPMAIVQLTSAVTAAASFVLVCRPWRGDEATATETGTGTDD
ncbi:Bicyclomycin resistance protein [Streptomyces sp. YIM 130001]|uniref:multidrug effflux MFS transporter n=1 Tax=Streptomyces sp. YIM 130001 TaxID=2259644 RepID=UPI000E651B00|nr:multidrug effflux MFS transporter [Streptomyces sp. YIM 130001]RII13476.1 Bicyclomycin resistance protein [Streptomyces sp. YIM 130001]